MPESPKPPEQDSKNAWRQYGRFSNLAFVLPGAVLMGLLIGVGLDHWFKTSWMTLAGLLLGSVAGFFELMRGAIKAGKES
jgi:F0F1-type ATP synthase assembly protein I